MSVHLALVASAAMTAPSSLQTGVPVSTVSIAGRARRALALYRAATPLSPSVVLRYT